jgi:acetolactate decarboxylase
MESKGTTMPTENSIYLCAPVNALVEGIFEENVPFTEIRKHGDFGLGTFNDLDGEMVMLDGRIYQITSEGHVTVIDDNTLTPFACVTFYNPVSHDEIAHELTYEAFLEWLYRLLPSPNIFYALRIEGEFARIKARSVPKQENYRSLVEVAQEQTIFNFGGMAGTLVGFFTPTFMSSLNVPGLHLHFLSADFRYGGHLLECYPQKVRAGVQFINKLELALPMSLDYLTGDFQRDTAQDLRKVEK